MPRYLAAVVLEVVLALRARRRCGDRGPSRPAKPIAGRRLICRRARAAASLSFWRVVSTMLASPGSTPRTGLALIPAAGGAAFGSTAAGELVVGTPLVAAGGRQPEAQCQTDSSAHAPVKRASDVPLVNVDVGVDPKRLQPVEAATERSLRKNNGVLPEDPALLVRRKRVRQELRVAQRMRHQALQRLRRSMKSRASMISGRRWH